MRGITSFTVHGRIAADPDMFQLSNGVWRCTVPVAVNLPRKAEDGSWDNDTVWFRFAWFGKTAESIEKRIKKGLPIVVTGEIRSYVQEIGDKKITRYNFKPYQASIIEERDRGGSGGDPPREDVPRESSREERRDSSSRREPPKETRREPPPRSEPVQQEMMDGDPFGDDEIPF